MRVRDLLSRKPANLITVEANAGIDTVVRLMTLHGVGGLPVLGADGIPAGFISERDIVRAVHEHRGDVAHLRVLDVKRMAPVCDADDPVEAVMRRMTREHLRHLLVREQGRVVGVLSVGDIVKHKLELLEAETGVLRDYVAAHRANR